MTWSSVPSPVASQGMSVLTHSRNVLARKVIKIFTSFLKLRLGYFFQRLVESYTCPIFHIRVVLSLC